MLEHLLRTTLEPSNFQRQPTPWEQVRTPSAPSYRLLTDLREVPIIPDDGWQRTWGDFSQRWHRLQQQALQQHRQWQRKGVFLQQQSRGNSSARPHNAMRGAMLDPRMHLAMIRKTQRESLSARGQVLLDEFKSCEPARIAIALEAYGDHIERARDALRRFSRLPNTTFNHKMKCVMKGKALESALARLRRRHRLQLVQIHNLGSTVTTLREQNERVFAAAIHSMLEEDREGIEFVVDAALLSEMEETLPWGRFVKELDKIGLTERHRALSNSQDFFAELHRKELLMHEGMIRTVVESASSALLSLAPALSPYLAEFGVDLSDVVPVLRSAQHNDWDELKLLLASPMQLVKQAAAVKCPVATFQFQFKLRKSFSDPLTHTPASIEALKNNLARQLGVSRLQVAMTLRKGGWNSSLADISILAIDAAAGNELMENLKSTRKNDIAALGAAILSFPLIRSIKMNKNKPVDRCTFRMLLADKLRREDSPQLCSTRHQNIDQALFSSVEMTMSGVMQKLYMGKILVVSHRWVAPGSGHPDPEGVQERAIKEFLRQHPEIELVWHDYWSVAQGARSKDEQRDYEAMLMSVTLLYLGGTVLILLDQAYLFRFWTSAEAWLSTRCCTPGGLQPAPNPEKRCKIVLLPGAAKELPGALFSMWSTKTIQDACGILSMNDMLVTNHGDKERLLAKLSRLHETVQDAWAELQEENLKKIHPILEQIIDQQKCNPLAVDDDGVLAPFDPNAPPKALFLYCMEGEKEPTHSDALGSYLLVPGAERHGRSVWEHETHQYTLSKGPKSFYMVRKAGSEEGNDILHVLDVSTRDTDGTTHTVFPQDIEVAWEEYQEKTGKWVPINSLRCTEP